MAPLYDAVTTRVLPRLEHDRMALKLNGKDDRLRRADFRTLSATAGLSAADAASALDEMLSRIGQAIKQICLPKGIGLSAGIENAVERMLDICRARLDGIN
jgi:serine/threonine-protein kinase HipA